MNLYQPIDSANNSPPWELVAFLENLGASKKEHSGRTLLDHLVGTYRILRCWGCDDDTCIAGLFHSVYGTSSFSSPCVSFTDRDDVALRTGVRAERLAFLFSIATRPQGLVRSASTLFIASRADGAEIPITLCEAKDLITIECANLYEQGEVRFIEAILQLDEPLSGSLIDAKVAENILVFLNNERRIQDA